MRGEVGLCHEAGLAKDKRRVINDAGNDISRAARNGQALTRIGRRSKCSMIRSIFVDRHKARFRSRKIKSGSSLP